MDKSHNFGSSVVFIRFLSSGPRFLIFWANHRGIRLIDRNVFYRRRRGKYIIRGYALNRQLGQDIVEIVDVGISVARSVGAPFGLVVDFVPGDGVVRSGGGRDADSESQPTFPGDDQQFKDHPAFGVVRKIALSRKSGGCREERKQIILITPPKAKNMRHHDVNGTSCLGRC